MPQTAPPSSMGYASEIAKKMLDAPVVVDKQLLLRKNAKPEAKAKARAEAKAKAEADAKVKAKRKMRSTKAKARKTPALAGKSGATSAGKSGACPATLAVGAPAAAMTRNSGACPATPAAGAPAAAMAGKSGASPATPAAGAPAASAGKLGACPATPAAGNAAGKATSKATRKAASMAAGHAAKKQRLAPSVSSKDKDLHADKIARLPPAARPQEPMKGKHSYTVKDPAHVSTIQVLSLSQLPPDAFSNLANLCLCVCCLPEFVAANTCVTQLSGPPRLRAQAFYVRPVSCDPSPYSIDATRGVFVRWLDDTASAFAAAQRLALWA